MGESRDGRVVTSGRRGERSRRLLRFGWVVPLLVALWAVGASPSVATGGSELAIYRVTVDTDQQVQSLIAQGYDVLEARESDDIFVMASGDEVDDLRADGFTVIADRLLPALGPAGDEFAMATFFGGYRSWDEHEAKLRSVAATHPDLAQIVDYGDSWRKINGRPGGNDLLAICLTDQQPGDCARQPDGAKPRAVIMSAIHARELTTAEVAWRLVDDLVAGYGDDADITTILDTTEVWIIPVANPDGRELVEQGGNAPYLQRKNANDSRGTCARPPTSANQHGIDLNRNASTGWGGPGTSTNPCAATYRGTSAASEPEQQALEALFADLWPARSGSPGTPVPDDTTGVFISLHSYGELVFIPPGSGPLTPDDSDLRALAFRMSHHNGYRTGAPSEILYSVSGTTDEFTYGELGVASATYELGPSAGSCGGFTPPYSCVDSQIYPDNRDALLYALTVAASPYTSPAGPVTDALQVPGGTLTEPFTVTAVTDDDALGRASGSVGRPSVQTIAEVEVYVGAGPWEGGTPRSMSPVDGRFDQWRESATAEVPTAGLAPGRQPVYVRARDAAGNWGPVAAAFVTIGDDPDPTPGSIAGTVRRDGTGVAQVQVDHFEANPDGSRGRYVSSTRTTADGSYRLADVEPGCWVVTFVAPAGERFVDGDSWLNRSGCLDPGQAIDGVDAQLVGGSAGGVLGGSVRRAGEPAAGVAVDLFEATGDGSRGPWLGQARSGPDGAYRFDVGAGCFVATFIAPEGQTFTNGSPWLNRFRCVAAGEQITDVDAELGVGGTASISGSVTRNGTGVAQVLVDRFQAMADGSRGPWLGDTTTDGSGRYRFEVEPGCHVLTFVAPSGQTFVNGSGWFNAAVCVDEGQDRSGVDAVLAD